MSLRLTTADARALAARLPPKAGRAIRGALKSTPSGAPGLTTKAAARPKRDPASGPQARLFSLLSASFPGALQDYRKAIPGRRYEIDIAFPVERVAVEVDGWEWHGKYLNDFLRDRAKRNMLALMGWVILAYPARDVRREPARLLSEVGQALAMARERRSAAAADAVELF